MNTSLRFFTIFTLLVLAMMTTDLLAQTEALWRGHRAFGDGRYGEAIDAYKTAIAQGSSWEWLPDFVETVKQRQKLGHIIPADTHNIMVIYVVELNKVTGNGVETTRDVTDEQKENWETYFKVFKQTLESFSDGHWTIKFDTRDAISTYHEGSRLKPDNPDHLNFGDDFFETMAHYDSYITLSNTRSPAHGLARQYPYLNGVLYGPHRGMDAINAGTHGYGVLLHEFFHIIEWLSNAIGTAHGFEVANRGNFPEWKGTTEFDYYRWHFKETLSKYSWQRLNHRTRWIPFESNDKSLNAIKEVYKTIPLKDRQKADTLFDEGKALRSKSIETAASKWKEALALSPYHEESLEELFDYYRFIDNNEQRASEIYNKLKQIRSVGAFYTLDSLNRDYGHVVGMWFKEDINKDWEAKDWDVTPFISKAGCYDFTFYYTKGSKALDTDSVAILENSIPIALDAHIGFSGYRKTDITYHLQVPAYKKKANYALRARIKGNKGVNSYGQIHGKYVGVSCVEEK